MVGIVIPFFKITYFHQTLESLAKQTNKNFHVYIGNDNSLDDPEQLLKRYKTSIDYTYKRFKNNLGSHSLTKQWDRCLEMIKDENWIMILGDDDYLSPNYIEKFYEHKNEIEGLEINVVRFSTIVINEISGINSEPYTHPKLEKATDFFFNKFFNSSRGSLSEHIFTRKSYVQHGFRHFPLGWGADNFAWLDFTEFGYIYTINDARAYFRISNEHISRKGYQDILKQQTRFDYFKIIIEEYLDKFKKEQRFPLIGYYEQLGRLSQNLSLIFYLKICKLLIREKRYLEILKYTRRMFYYKYRI